MPDYGTGIELNSVVAMLFTLGAGCDGAFYSRAVMTTLADHSVQISPAAMPQRPTGWTPWRVFPFPCCSVEGRLHGLFASNGADPLAAVEWQFCVNWRLILPSYWNGPLAMKMSAAYGPGKFGLSFELFPPKSPPGEATLFEHVARLVEFQPSFITCTYGAGGSTRDTTLSIVSRVHREFQLPVATHLTCVGATVDDLRDYLRRAAGEGIENIVALRGDPPRGDATFRPVPGGLAYANELVQLIRGEFEAFDIAVAGYPEKHQEAPSPEVDLENLKRKVDAGADVVITQLFYDNADFFRFRERCQRTGIRVPIVPGLLPITNFAQIKRITALCGAKLPRAVVAGLEAADDDADAQFALGVEAAIRQTQELIGADVPGIHFYVLNRSEAAARVLSEVKLPLQGK